MEIQELKKHRWDKEFITDEQGKTQCVIKNQDGNVVCRVHMDDYKFRGATEYQVTCDLIEIAPQLFETYTGELNKVQ